MQARVWLVIVAIILNFIFAVMYLVYGLVFTQKQKDKHQKKEDAQDQETEDEEDKEGYNAYEEAEETDDAVEIDELLKEDDKEEEVFVTDKKRYIFIFIVMLACPIVVEVIFLFGWLWQKIFFRREVDLADVVFSKDRVRPQQRGDDERERNMVPLEEALAVTDKKNLRSLMLNILKGDIQDSLSVIMQALGSEDTETAHYAASVLSSELNEFRMNVQRIYELIMKSEGDIRIYCASLLKYMNAFLKQGVFSDMEQQSYARMMQDVTEVLYGEDATLVTPQQYEWLTDQLLEAGMVTDCEKWCQRAIALHPDQLSSYTSLMKYYFHIGDRGQFLRVLGQLRKTNITIDSKTLELIRLFT